MDETLTADDYNSVAASLGVPVAAIKAVAEVESAGAGFDANGNMKLLFEGHIFYKYLKAAGYNADEIAKNYPNICYKTWAQRGDAYKLNQLDQLKQAIKIDEEVAFKSASYGRFQVMGFNCVACGFATAKSMYAALVQSEKAQLDAFCVFIKTNRTMYAALKALDWAAFAKAYNGTGYEENKYDTKLAAAYAKYAKGA